MQILRHTVVPVFLVAPLLAQDPASPPSVYDLGHPARGEFIHANLDNTKVALDQVHERLGRTAKPAIAALQAAAARILDTCPYNRSTVLLTDAVRDAVGALDLPFVDRAAIAAPLSAVLAGQRDRIELLRRSLAVHRQILDQLGIPQLELPKPADRPSQAPSQAPVRGPAVAGPQLVDPEFKHQRLGATYQLLTTVKTAVDAMTPAAKADVQRDSALLADATAGMYNFKGILICYRAALEKLVKECDAVDRLAPPEAVRRANAELRDRAGEIVRAISYHVALYC